MNSLTLNRFGWITIFVATISSTTLCPTAWASTGSSHEFETETKPIEEENQRSRAELDQMKEKVRKQDQANSESLTYNKNIKKISDFLNHRHPGSFWLKNWISNGEQHITWLKSLKEEFRKIVPRWTEVQTQPDIDRLAARMVQFKNLELIQPTSLAKIRADDEKVCALIESDNTKLKDILELIVAQLDDRRSGPIPSERTKEALQLSYGNLKDEFTRQRFHIDALRGKDRVRKYLHQAIAQSWERILDARRRIMITNVSEDINAIVIQALRDPGVYLFVEGQIEEAMNAIQISMLHDQNISAAMRDTYVFSVVIDDMEAMVESKGLSSSMSKIIKQTLKEARSAQEGYLQFCRSMQHQAIKSVESAGDRT